MIYVDEIHQKRHDRYCLLSDRSGIRTLMYDITQHIYFKRFVAMLVMANFSLLTVPVSNLTDFISLMYVYI